MRIKRLRIPDTFEYFEHEEDIISNFKFKINHVIERRIKGKPRFSLFLSWNFYGKVWWNIELKIWCCEVWERNRYNATYGSSELSALANEVNFNHRISESLTGLDPFWSYTET